jgi:hypothetical protein
MKSIGPDCKGAQLSRYGYVFLTAAIGFFVAAGFIVGGQMPGRIAPPQTGLNFAGAERYLTHVATDKPIYRTGEKLYVRGVLLGANGHAPVTGSGTTFFEIKGPKGDTVTDGRGFCVVRAPAARTRDGVSACV